MLKAVAIGVVDTALLVRGDGSDTPAMITNVSQRRFRLKVIDTPKTGEDVIIR